MADKDTSGLPLARSQAVTDRLYGSVGGNSRGIQIGDLNVRQRVVGLGQTGLAGPVRYVRTPPVTVTFTTGSPGTVNWTAHGLLADDPVVFSLPRDKGVCTATIASPGVLTKNGHGFAADDPVKLSTTGALPTGLSAGWYEGGTTLYVRNPTANTFELATTVGGASIATSGTQSGVHRVMRSSSMPVGLTEGTIYFVRNPTTNAFEVSATAGGASINLTGANAIGKVRGQTGNDSNDGTANDRAHAWLTWNRAVQYANDETSAGSDTVKAYFAEGYYVKGSIFGRKGSATAYCLFSGVQSAHHNGNCVIAGSITVTANYFTHLFLEEFTIRPSGQTACQVFHNGMLELQYIEISLKSNGLAWDASQYSKILNYTDMWIVGNGAAASYFALVQTYGSIYVANAGTNVYFENISFSIGVIVANANSYIRIPVTSFPTNGTTGKKFALSTRSLISAAGSDASYIPGDVAGTVDDTSAYVASQGYNLVTQYPVSTYAGRPTAPPEGMFAIFTDSNTAAWGATIAGGGANRVLGYFNGTNWTVAAL